MNYAHSPLLPGNPVPYPALATPSDVSRSDQVLLTRRNFSFMGGFLFVGMVIALIAGLLSLFGFGGANE